MKLTSISTTVIALGLALASVACGKGDAKRTGPVFDPETGTYTLPDENLVDDRDFSETPVGINGKLRVEGPDLVNEAGELIQLRGVSSQWLNWETTGFATSGTVLKYMRDNWNVSLIRAAMGAGTDQGGPASGGYLVAPERMRLQVERIVENATKLGVYVLIDWHDHVAQDHVPEATEFFRAMAEQYKDNPSVLFEVFNEPIPRIHNTERTFTWERDIKPYHETLVNTIRQTGSDAVIILGTPMWSQEVDKAAADPVDGENLMYTLHFYACEHTQWLRDRAQAARDTGLPIFVTEWGATTASGGVPPETQVCDEEGDLWHQWMDENSISWAAWKLEDCADASCFFLPGTGLSANLSERLQGHGPFVVDKLLRRDSGNADGGTSPSAQPSSSAAPSASAIPSGSAAPSASAAPSTSAVPSDAADAAVPPPEAGSGTEGEVADSGATPDSGGAR